MVCVKPCAHKFSDQYDQVNKKKNWFYFSKFEYTIDSQMCVLKHSFYLL